MSAFPRVAKVRGRRYYYPPSATFACALGLGRLDPLRSARALPSVPTIHSRSRSVTARSTSSRRACDPRVGVLVSCRRSSSCWGAPGVRRHTGAHALRRHARPCWPRSRNSRTQYPAAITTTNTIVFLSGPSRSRAQCRMWVGGLTYRSLAARGRCGTVGRRSCPAPRAYSRRCLDNARATEAWSAPAPHRRDRAELAPTRFPLAEPERVVGGS